MPVIHHFDDSFDEITIGEPGDTLYIDGSYSLHLTSLASTTIFTGNGGAFPSEISGSGAYEQSYAPTFSVFVDGTLRSDIVVDGFTDWTVSNAYALGVDGFKAGQTITVHNVSVLAIPLGAGFSLEATGPSSFRMSDARGVDVLFGDAPKWFESDPYRDGTPLHFVLAKGPGLTTLALPPHDTPISFEVGSLLVGTSGADTLKGGSVADDLYGGGGDDYLQANGGDDLVVAGDGDDRLSGMDGNDKLYGGNGADQVDGGTGSDQLYGGAGDDKLQGRDGDDAIFGGSGKDDMTGGAGADTFVFEATDDSSPGHEDIIRDFTHGVDHISLSAIDAVSGGGDDAFNFVDHFTGHAGELAQVHLFGTTWAVQGDVNGDGVADFSIIVMNAGPLVPSDFYP